MQLKLRVSTLLLFVPATVFAADDPKLDTQQEKFSYTVGFQIGQQLKSDAADVDVSVVGRAIQDVLADKEPALSMETMQQAMQTYQEGKIKQQMAAADTNRKKGEEFLAQNKKKKGIKETASGLQYEVIEKGSGESPKAENEVVVHYRGTLIDGTEFDSSYKRGEPITFGVGNVIPGWQEALKLMSEGAKWKVYIPSDLAYGPRGSGGAIGPNETLVFDIELLDVK